MIPLAERIAYARAVRHHYPNYSACGRCELPWAVCDSHITDYDERHGCFPLCEDCWQELETPDARLPFYMAMCDWWETMSEADDERRETIRRAVLNEE